jgi:alcohol dehydrogenase
LSSRIRSFGVEKPLVVTDGFLSKTDMFKEMIEDLRENKFDPAIWSNTVLNPTDKSVNDGFKTYQDEVCDGVVGFGGGSSMDTAKCIGVLAYHNESDIGKFMVKNGKRLRKVEDVVPVVCVPTTSGTGVEIAKGASITDTSTKSKTGVKGQTLSKLAIVDPYFTLSMPPKITASTGMDAFVHAFETYTSKKANLLTDVLALKAIKLVAENLRKAVFDGSDIKTRTNMSLAALLAGIAFSNGSLHLGHLMGFIIAEKYNIPHGMSMAVVYPEILEFILPASTEKLGRIAGFFEVKIKGFPVRTTAKKTVKAISQMIKDIGMPSLTEATGASSKKAKWLAELTIKKFKISSSPRRVTKNDYYKMFLKAFSK